MKDRLLYVLFFLSVSNFSSEAQGLSDYIFEGKLDFESGNYLRETVHFLFHDNRGQIWLTSDGDLYSYDGLTFSLELSLPSRIMALKTNYDTSQVFLISEENKLLQYHLGNHKTIQEITLEDTGERYHTFIRNHRIDTDDQNRLWILGDNGLSCYNDMERVLFLSFQDVFNISKINTIEKDINSKASIFYHNKYLFFAVGNGRCFKLDENGQILKTYTLYPEHNSVLEKFNISDQGLRFSWQIDADDSVLLYISGQGLYRYDLTNDDFKAQHLPQEITDKWPQYFSIGNEGGFWFSGMNYSQGERKTYCLDFKNKVLKDYTPELKEIVGTNLIRNIVSGPTSNNWVLSEKTLIQASPKIQFIKSYPTNSKLKERVFGIGHTAGGIKYMSTYNTYLIKHKLPDTDQLKLGYHSTNKSYYTFVPDTTLPAPSEQVSSFGRYAPSGKFDKPELYIGVTNDSSNDLWMSGYGLLNVQNDSIKLFKGPYDFIPAISQYDENHLLFTPKTFLKGNLEKGLFLLNIHNNQIFRFKAVPDSLFNETSIYNIHMLDNQYIAMAGNTGLIIYDLLKQETQLFNKSTKGFMEIRKSYCYDIHADSNYYWLATRVGLYRKNIKEKKSELISLNEGLPHNRIYKIIPEGDSILWLSTQGGLSRVEKSSLQIRNFFEEDGLIESEFVLASGNKDVNGNINLGTYNGYATFNPKDYYRSIYQDYRPRIILTALEKYNSKSDSIFTYNENLTSLNSIDIQPNEISLKMNFQYLNFDHPEKNTFSYKIEELNPNWITLQSNKLELLSLPYGNYRLKVKATSYKGIASSNELSYELSVVRPWFKTKWFYSLIALAVCLISFGIFRYRINELIRYQKLRTRISSDLHDDVGTTLTALAIQSEVFGLDAGPELNNKFKSLATLAREAMSSMRDTVWAIDSRKDNIDSLSERIKDHLLDSFESKKVTYSFKENLSQSSRKIAPNIRQNFYLIFKEAVANFIKHSNGDHLSINLDLNRNLLCLLIKDNGQVDKNKIKKSGLGMDNMHLRTQRIMGTIRIDNTNGFLIEVKSKV